MSNKIKDMPFREKIKLAQNDNTPADVLRELANSDYKIRREVAMNPNTPEDTLRDLAKDENATVRLYSAKNHNTPEDALRKLYKDTDWEVREQVANNPKVSSFFLVKIFEYEKSLKYPEKNVINALYVNANFPEFAKRVIETLFEKAL